MIAVGTQTTWPARIGRPIGSASPPRFVALDDHELGSTGSGRAPDPAAHGGSRAARRGLTHRHGAGGRVDAVQVAG